MILCNLPVLLAKRRMKVADLIRMIGISKSTMDKIFEALDIEVGDFFTYVPNDSVEKEK